MEQFFTAIEAHSTTAFLVAAFLIIIASSLKEKK